MVRTIDAAARRRALAEAVWRIVERDGLAAASVRTVAKESGLATGSVRHFFGTQHELIVFAMRELIDTVGDRIRVAAAEGSPEERAVAALAQLVPLTPQSRSEAFAHLQFVTAARFDPDLAAIAAESFAGIRAVCEQVVDLLREAGRFQPHTDLATAPATLAALVDGLTFELLLAPDLLTTAQAEDLLRDTVTRLTGGPT